MVLLAGRLLREGVLQQSALSANDAFCSAAKTAALVDAVLDVVDALRGGRRRAACPPPAIEELDFAPAAPRPRDETPARRTPTASCAPAARDAVPRRGSEALP